MLLLLWLFLLRLLLGLEQKLLHPLVVFVKDSVDEIKLGWVNGWVNKQEPRVAPDRLRQEQFGIRSFLLLERHLGVHCLPCPGQVCRSDVDWVELTAQGKDGRILDDADREVLPLLNLAIWCLSFCRRESTVEEALHERQRRLEGKLIA